MPQGTEKETLVVKINIFERLQSSYRKTKHILQL